MPKMSEERSKKFKKDDFALQLMIAIGDRPTSMFCKQAGLDYKMVKNYLNEARDVAPGFKFLKRIANTSCDKSVTLESLAVASGFTKSMIEAKDKNETKVKEVKKPAEDKPKQEKPVASTLSAASENRIPATTVTYSSDRFLKESFYVQDKKAPTDKKPSIDLSTFICLAETYDEHNPVRFYIFDNKDAFVKFGKLVRLYGLNKAMDTAEKDERPVFDLDANIISKFLSDRPITMFSALNGNKIAIVL